MRYKIVEHPPTPDSAVVGKYQDFEKLIHNYHAVGNHPAFRGADQLSLIISVVLVSYALFSNFSYTSLVNYELVELDHISAEKSISNPPAMPQPQPQLAVGTEMMLSDEKAEEQASAFDKVQEKIPQIETTEDTEQVQSSYVAASPDNGFKALYQYFSDSLNYPLSAEGSNISGEVIIEFAVTQKGEIAEVKVIKSLGTDFDQEAKRLIRGMPKWQPAMVNGHAIKSRMSLPVVFNSRIRND